MNNNGKRIDAIIRVKRDFIEHNIYFFYILFISMCEKFVLRIKINFGIDCFFYGKNNELLDT